MVRLAEQPRRRVGGRGAACRAIALACVTSAGLIGCGERAGEGTTGGVEVVFGEVGTSPGQFAYPRAMASDGRGLWIVDKQARVQRMVPTERGGSGAGWRSEREFQMPEWSLGKPTGLSVGPMPGGRGAGLYVADTHYHRVMAYATGEGSAAIEGSKPAWAFGQYGREPGQLIYPTDVAVAAWPDGGSAIRIYVTEYGGNDRVSVFESREDAGDAGSEIGPPVCLKTFGEFGEADEEKPSAVVFNRPQAIEADADRGRLIVADAGHHRLGVFTPEGELVRWIGWPRGGPEHADGAVFTYPYGLAVLGDGTVLVAEFGGNRVQRVDVEQGRSLGVWGTAGRGPGQVASPWAVATIDDGLQGEGAYVLDSGNNRVQRLDLALPASIAADVKRPLSSSSVASGGVR